MSRIKELIVKRNSFGIGYDVGWRVWSPKDEKWCEIYWGNTKGRHSLKAMIGDAIAHGYIFRLDHTAQSLLDHGEIIEHREVTPAPAGTPNPHPTTEWA